MTLGSSEDTVAILYDNENAPFEMLDFALKKARLFLPCRMIVVADWDSCPEQKRWQKLMSRPGFTFRQIERTREGANSLDYALADTARMMCREGVSRFVFITNDADFADIAKALRELNNNVVLVGVGGEQANNTLREAYNKFICYKPRTAKEKEDSMDRRRKPRMNNNEDDVQDNEPKLQTNIPQPPAELVLAKGGRRTARTARANNGSKSATPRTARTPRKPRNAKPADVANTATENAVTANTEKVNLTEDTPKAGIGTLSVHIPKTLHQQLLSRMTEENVDMNQLVTYILMQGINK